MAINQNSKAMSLRNRMRPIKSISDLASGLQMGGGNSCYDMLKRWKTRKNSRKHWTNAVSDRLRPVTLGTASRSIVELIRQECPNNFTRDLQLFPYKIQIVQKLFPNDLAARIEFRNMFRQLFGHPKTTVLFR